MDPSAASPGASSPAQPAPMVLPTRRGAGSLIGRPREVAAVERELETAAGGAFSAVTLEGEPGIGKSRLMAVVAELAEARGFTVLAVTADEELRVPFLVARGILGSPRAREALAGTPGADALARGFDAVTGRAEPGFEALPREERLLRAFDLASLAIQALVDVAPLAVLVDDAQWADEDSLRLLRYVTRTSGGCPILLVLALRPEESSELREAVTLLADMDRIGVVRRLQLARFSQAETGALARQLLAGDVDPATVAMLHAQSEGVPFIAEELIRAYRSASMIQQVDGVWTAARNAERMVPSAVRTLIDRRAARLDSVCRTTLAEAAALGRRVSLRDLSALRERLGEQHDAATIAELLAPAVAAGLLVTEDGTAADYRFPHEQVREQAQAVLQAPRRRELHAAIVAMLTASGAPPPESLASLAHHARAAGDEELAARFSAEAARAALASNAPEEALRLARLGLASGSEPAVRAQLLRVQDEALETLRQPNERVAGLAELEALAEALGDASLGLEAVTRRAATFRMLQDCDRAAELARAARGRAAAAGDAPSELAATLELGQALLGMALGDGFVPVESEIDGPGAREAFERAVAIATELGDDRALAASTRELGVVEMSAVRTALLELMTGARIPEDLLEHEPVAGPLMRARNHFEAALGLYERLGDRRGAMLSIISLAYSTWGAEGVLGSARHLEAIRRLNNSLERLTTESERAVAEAELLYAIHVYAANNGFPDLALQRGTMAHRAAREMGDRGLEFGAAGGLASVHLQLDDVEEAERWLDRAGAAATASPTPLRTRRLEAWRGVLAARRGDGDGLVRHLERAATLAAEQGRTAGRCEALATLAVEAARLGRARQDSRLLEVASQAAGEAISLAGSLAGQPIWPIEAQAALADVALAHEDTAAAMAAARAIGSALSEGGHKAVHPEVIRPMAEALSLSEEAEDQDAAVVAARGLVGLVAERIADASIAQRWFRSSALGPLVELAGGVDAARAAVQSTPGSLVLQRLPKLPLALEDDDMALVRLMMEGQTDAEIAVQLGTDEATIRDRLGDVLSKMGAPSRSVATLYAFMAGVI